ncbi:MAG: hypothetical protein GX579_04305 [Chloroflexi bacterium]|jgi:hypothetical protein|nr:hypothetical protein [Chloroflexota bacterium]
MNYPDIAGVTFEETPERLKVVLPVRRQWPYLLVYSVLMLTWLGATVWMLTLLFGVSRGDMSVRFLIVWVIILLIWAYLWYRLGSFVWRWWQYFAATREILLVSPATLIVRRPLSLLGVTDAYAMEHVSPFYYSEKNGAVAFDYGSRGGLFGLGLERPAAQELIAALNRRFFPHALDEDDEE